jgi:peptide/nickel transport system substrate-binding protein
MEKKMEKKGLLVVFALLLCFVVILGSPGAGKAADPPKDRLVPEITVINCSPAFDPRRYESENLVVQNCEKLGIKTKMVALEFTPAWDRITQETDWDIGYSSWRPRAERVDPHTLLYMLYKTGELTNWARYSNPEIDRLLEMQLKEMNVDKRREIVFKIQEIVAQEVPYISLYHSNHLTFYNNQRFTNVKPTVEGLVNVWSLRQMKPLSADEMIKIGNNMDIDTINPMAAVNVEKECLVPMIYDRLAVYDTTGEPVPSVAESWKAIDNTTCDVVIRRGMKFHDGKPLTAEDVKFSFDFQKKWKVVQVTQHLGKIKEVQVLEPYKVRFRLEEPYAPLVNVVFYLTSILPKHIWEDVVKRENLAQPQNWANPNCIGSGPFKFVYWRKGEEFKLVRNDQYYDPAKSAGILFKIYAHSDALFLGLRNGEVDVNYNPLLPGLVEQAKNVKHLSEVPGSSITVHQIGFNCQRLPFKRMELRQAVAHAVDYDTIVHTILMDQGIAGKGMIAPANKFWHNPNQRVYEFDMGKAKKLLMDAGYEWGSDGRLYYPAK